MKKTCENCITRSHCEPYQDEIRARAAGCNFTGYGDKDDCFRPDPIKEVMEKKIKENRKRANRMRQDRDQALKDLGLVKVRGALGGVYWE